MERRKRERSRSPADSKEHYREKYSRERYKDRYERKDTDHKRDDTKTSLHDRGERGHKFKKETREKDRREHGHERLNQPRREEHEERSIYDDQRNTNRRENERTTRPDRDRSRDRISHRNDEQREEQRRDRRHDFRGDRRKHSTSAESPSSTPKRRERKRRDSASRDQGEEHRGQRRPGFHGRQRGRRRESDNEPDDSSRYGQPAGEQGTNEAAVEAEKPNFGLSGKLTEYTNTYKGVVIKYNEPPEGRKPKTRWRLYPFKGEEGLPVLYIHRQSAYLLGRQRHIADIPIDHPSCSKQHAVLQYRLANYDRPDGTSGRKVKPYIIDLESANGTFLNNQKIDPRRYYELKERDVLKFGFSSREYVILHERSSNVGEEDTENPGEGAGSDSDASSDASPE